MTQAIDKPKQWDRLNLNVYATKEPVPVKMAPRGLIQTDWGIFYKSSMPGGWTSTWALAHRGGSITLLEAMQKGMSWKERRLLQRDYGKIPLVWPLAINDREPGDTP